MLNPIPGIPTQNQTTDLTLKQQKPKLDNSLTYHRWMVGMQCRKDILIENQVINKRTIIRVTPLWNRIQTQVKNNKMRLAYFFGFCVLFSMDKIYDWVVVENPLFKKIENNMTSVANQRSKIIKQQYQISKQIKQTGIDEQKKKQLAELYMKLDKNIILNSNFMNRIGRTKSVNIQQKYEKEYVDLGSFIKFFKQDNVDDIKSRIRGELPYLSLLI